MGRADRCDAAGSTRAGVDARQISAREGARAGQHEGAEGHRCAARRHAASKNEAQAEGGHGAPPPSTCACHLVTARATRPLPPLPIP
jgi:hypothetical protein